MARPRKGIKKIDGQWIFYDFSKGLYLLDTPRNIGEQLYSLAMVGGRNCWSEKGALVSQYGYLSSGASIPLTDPMTGYTRIVAGNQNFFITTVSGRVYLYTASEGLKEFATVLPSALTPILTRRGKDMIIHDSGVTSMYGGFYAGATDTVIMSNVTLLHISNYYTFTASEEYMKYFWSDKDVSINGTDNMRVLSVTQTKEQELNNTFTAKLTAVGESKEYPDKVTIGEKTRLEVNLVYVPENVEPAPPPSSGTPTEGETTTDTTVTEEANQIHIDPQLMEVANNRLFVVDTDGTIYYTAIGLVGEGGDLNFKQSAGAGFFAGFYNDTSKVLSIEDFLNGTLIVKEGGFYYLTITASTSATGSAIYTVNIEKISNCGQKYASDHVIVREKVYAFDTNSGTIVNAISVNMFGAMVSGKPVISAEYLNAQNSGINSSKRWLTYNAEAEVFILYYGENLNQGLVLTNVGTLFPRELDKQIEGFVGFNQGVAFITSDGEICQDFKKGTIVPNMTCVAEFEPIGLRDNRMICSSIIELTELNGVTYDLTTRNAGSAYQKVKPVAEADGHGVILPPMMYSDRDINMIIDSFSMESKWADKKANVTRMYAPMSGREGVGISIEFPANTAFCLSAIRLPDFSQGE